MLNLTCHSLWYTGLLRIYAVYCNFFHVVENENRWFIPKYFLSIILGLNLWGSL